MPDSQSPDENKSGKNFVIEVAPSICGILIGLLVLGIILAMILTRDHGTGLGEYHSHVTAHPDDDDVDHW